MDPDAERLVARTNLYPDTAARPSSAAVRVYQLRDRAVFDSASYDDLLTNDKQALGQDCVDSTAAIVEPGSAASLTQQIKPETQNIGIAASAAMSPTPKTGASFWQERRSR